MSNLSVDLAELTAALGAGYEVRDQLGQGGFGTVFKAIQTSTGQPVAIKVQRLGRDLSPEQRTARIARFERETKLCAMLNHPQIVRIMDRGRSGDCLFMVFEYVPGETLTTLLARRRTLPAPEAVALLGQVLEALASAHAMGVAHRDLKPDNIMVVGAGGVPYVKVLDFGIGAYLTDAAVDLAPLTRSHEILGTPCYSAPEQLRGEPATARSDIYAWGLVMLECLTGQRVMDGATVAQVYHRQLSTMEVPLPPALATHPLGEVLRKALAKVPRERAGDAARLLGELREVRVHDLVGALAAESSARAAKTVALGRRAGEQRQATVFCFSLNVVPAGPHPPDVETFDAIQRDQLNLCVDVATRFGGHVTGRLGNRVVAVFGLPQASDSDARRACRAALELSARMEARRALLSSQRGVDLELRIGIHTDIVLVSAEGDPSGPALNVAARLESLATPGATLVGEPTRNLLHRRLRFAAAEGQLPGGLRAYTLLGEGTSEASNPLLGGEPRSPLVGRERELDALAAHWERARAGHGGGVLLRGEPGVGKSRLVREMRKRALTSAAEVHDCQCLPEELNSALSPVLALVRQRYDLDPVAAEGAPASLGEALAAAGLPVETALPILCSWLALPPPAHLAPVQLSPDRQRALLLDALAGLLATPAPGEARLLVIEDVHWSDPTTRELCERVVARAAQAALLVLLTARPELTAVPDGVEVIEVEGLDRAAALRLVAANAGEGALDTAAIADIVERAGGIPLFVEELTRSLAAGAPAPAAAAGEGGAIPASLRDLLSGRLDRLGAAKETAQLAAAIGREFDLALLDAVSLRGAEALQADLDLLCDADMLRQKLHASGAGYVFRHALIRDAAWNSMLGAQRRSAHKRIASTLEARQDAATPREPARLAWHYELADDKEKAAGYRLAAGQQAAQASAYKEAIEHLRAGLALCAGITEPGLRGSLELDLLTAQGGILLATQGLATDAVVETFTRCWELVRAGTASPLQSFRALRGIWMFQNARAAYTEARESSARLLALASGQAEAELHLAAHECATQTALLTGDYEATIAHSQACNRWFDPARHREHIVRYGGDPWLTSLSFACVAKLLRGFVAEAAAESASIVERTRALGVPSVLSAMLGQAAWLELLQSAPERATDRAREAARARVAEAIALAQQFGFAFGEGYGRLLGAMIGALGGETDGVLGLEQSIAMWRMVGSGAFLSWPLAFLAQGRLVRGELAEARVQAEAAWQHCEKTGEAYGAVESQRVLALVLSAPGAPGADPAQALRAFDKALAIARAQGAAWLALRAAYSFAAQPPTGAAERARRELGEELTAFERRNPGLAPPLVEASRRLLR